MVIAVRCDKWEIKKNLVDYGSYAYILYWDAFERLRLDPVDLKPFKGSLVGFSGEQVQVKGCIMLKIIFRKQEHAKEIKVKYLVIDAPLFLQYDYREIRF